MKHSIFLFLVLLSVFGQAKEKIILAAGCFWGVEEFFRKVPGVVETGVGYTGGATKNPTYYEVAAEKTGHAEAVEVIFDEKKVKLEKLLDLFFKMHDPTTLNRQGNDKGTQYRSAIYFHTSEQEKIINKFKLKVEKSNAWKVPLTTTVTKATTFYEAEEEHQKYLLRKPNGYDNHYLRNLNFSVTAAHANNSHSCVVDVFKSVENISKKKRYDLAFSTDHKVEGLYYTVNPLAYFGLHNHFQGLVRIPDTRYMLLTGALRWESKPQIFVIEMKSRSQNDSFYSNLTRGTFVDSIPSVDRIVKVIDIPDGEGRWHAGSLSVLKNIVAVPLEKNNSNQTTKVLFYDFTEPLNPIKLDVEITTNSKAGAVSLERLENGRFLLALNSHQLTSFYISNTSILEDGFTQKQLPSWLDESRAPVGGEAIQLIHQCDGRLFLIDLDNDGLLPPLVNGHNWIRLHEILGLSATLNSRLEIKNLLQLSVDCGDFCNFKAASSIYVGADKKLKLYGSQFYRNLLGTRVHFAEITE